MIRRRVRIGSGQWILRVKLLGHIASRTAAISRMDNDGIARLRRPLAQSFFFDLLLGRPGKGVEIGDGRAVGSTRRRGGVAVAGYGDPFIPLWPNGPAKPALPPFPPPVPFPPFPPLPINEAVPPFPPLAGRVPPPALPALPPLPYTFPLEPPLPPAPPAPKKPGSTGLFLSLIHI